MAPLSLHREIPTLYDDDAIYRLARLIVNVTGNQVDYAFKWIVSKQEDSPRLISKNCNAYHNISLSLWIMFNIRSTQK